MLIGAAKGEVEFCTDNVLPGALLPLTLLEGSITPDEEAKTPLVPPDKAGNDTVLYAVPPVERTV